jgi:hypothetical protein
MKNLELLLQIKWLIIYLGFQQYPHSMLFSVARMIRILIT